MSNKDNIENDGKQKKQDDVEIMSPNYSLKKEVGEKVSLDKVIDEKKVAKAQEAIQDESKNFEEHILQDIIKLAKARRNIEQREGDEKQNREIMNKISLDIKSNAGFFGYNLATEIAKCLFNYLEKTEHISQIDMVIIKAQIDMLKLIFKNKIKGEGDNTAKKILISFKEINKKLE